MINKIQQSIGFVLLMILVMGMTIAPSHRNRVSSPPATIPIKGVLTPDTLRSDHAPFWYQGIGAVLVTDTANLRNPHYHQPTDIVEDIARQFFLGSAQLILNSTTT